MSLPIRITTPFRPLCYKHVLMTAHHIESYCTRDAEGRALVYKQVIHLKKKAA